MHNGSIAPPRRRCSWYLSCLFSALTIGVLLCSAVSAQVKQPRKQPTGKKVYVSIRNHIPPIEIIDGSFVVEGKRTFDLLTQQSGRYTYKYQGFNVGRVKVLDGEGERIYPDSPYSTCEGCSIRIWLKPPLSSDPQIVIANQGSDLTLGSDAQLTWDDDPNQTCQSNRPCRCGPIARDRDHRYSHPGYGGSFQFELVRITDKNGLSKDFVPPNGEHGGFRVMIWHKN
jgi:hypothetical protein